MKYLALKLPGNYEVSPPSDINTEIADLGSLVSVFLNIAFYASLFLAFYFLVWGAFAYILASGKKEDLAKAKARITWAIIGLFVVFLAYFIAKFASEIFPPGKGGLPF